MLVARARCGLVDDELGRRRRRLRAPRGRASRHGDGRAHAAAAGGADDVRLQGGGLARRRRRGADAARAALRAAGAARRRGGDARRARRRRARRCCALYAAELGLREPTAAVAHDPHAASPSSAAHSPAPPGRPRRSARDIVLLAQTEVGEVREAEGGGSSTMPHKRNPSGAVLAVACARHARANAGVLLESRRAGARARGRRLACRVACARRPRSRRRAARRRPMRRSLDGLEVDAARMRANIDATGRSSEARAARHRRRRRRRTTSASAGALRRPGARALPRDERHRRPLRVARLDAAMWDPQLPGARGPPRGRGRPSRPRRRAGTDVRTVDDLAGTRPRRGLTGRSRSSASRSAARSACGSRRRTRSGVERLVLACTSARFGEPEALARARGARPRQGLDAIVDAVLARWFTPGFRGVARVPRDAPVDRPEGYARCCEALARWDVRGELGASRRRRS